MRTTLERKAQSTLNCGVHSGVPFSKYCRIPAVNASTLIPYVESAKAGWEAEMGLPEDTNALTIGHASHTAVLEPDLFDSLYVIMPEFDGHPNSKAHREAKATWLEQHRQAVVLTQEQRDAALRIRDEVFDHPLARDIFSGKGKAELTVIGEYEGERTKARIDWLTVWQNKPCVVDLKTFRKSLTPHNVRTEITSRRYHVAAAWYIDRLNDRAPMDRRFIYVFANNAAPWDVAVYELEPDAIEQGQRDYHRAFTRRKHGRETGHYPGIAPALMSASIGAWAIDETID